MRGNNTFSETEVISLYQQGWGTEPIAKHLHIGKLKVRDVLKKYQIPMKTKGAQKLERTLKVQDWRIEKYPLKDGYHYIACSKDGNIIFDDYMNRGGYLTSYIHKTYNIEIPSLHDRKNYYMETGDYWWEQWFDIKLVPNKPTKKCPYCDWETEDISNKSGAFEVHLRQKHNISKMEYLKEHPEDKEYFTLVNETLNRQMSTNTDEYVTCAICGKKLSRINDKHLKSHGITRLEYIEKYGTQFYSKKHYEKLLSISYKMNLALENRGDIFTSAQEREIRQFILDNGLECKKNRSILNGKELDIFIPSKNLAIEFNGNKFHTEWFGGKTRQYHLQKTKMCNEKGIRLIHIFEDELYFSKEIVLNKIAHVLGIQQDLPRIMARKCQIQEITRDIAEDFLNTFHIQGFDPSTHYYGAYFENKLIAVMSFLKSRNNENNWELTRFASDFNYVCCGVGGKLFKHFIRKHNPSLVKSFADRRWTVDKRNNIYTQLGFGFDGYIPPDYRYYNPKIDKVRRFHKFGFRKQKLHKKYGLPLTMTESEMAKELGYDKIWDCGLFKFVWKRAD